MKVVDIIAVLVAVTLSACQKDTPPSNPAREISPVNPSDPAVLMVTRGIAELREILPGKYNAAAISSYKDITQELNSNGLIPKGWLVEGMPRNPWTGKYIVQLFPQDAWGPGIRPTYNIVVESIPKAQCKAIVTTIAGQVDQGILKINLEPSKKLINKLPLQGDDGCRDGVNNIGLTIYAK